jgi:hypothetical protein
MDDGVLIMNAQGNDMGNLDNLWELFYRKNDLTGEKGNR